MRFPDEPTTSEQWHVIFWTFIAVFIAIGLVGIYFSHKFPAANADLANQLRLISFAFWGLAAGINITMRFAKYFME